ncbi:hypothetical protein ACPCHT_24880 [Nucisporomicrobium flavum]|uniref:hypothetical protein n=1 Tax=Nucisporomicrobium flavum TaxID=2785915 RepID=UPI0018F414F7|nr:hypothetical protein [Nucisporomicrobium flavum]
MRHHLDDERYGRALLRPLAGEPAGQPRIDVSRAMAQGRRRRLTRWWASGTAIVALTATTAAGGTLAFSAVGRPGTAPRPVATPAPSITAAAPLERPKDCTVTRLPTGGVEKALVTGGDPSGHWVVGRTYPAGKDDGSRPLVIWKDGKIADTVRIGGQDQSFEDINKRGNAVGYTFEPGVRPYAYSNGKVTPIPGGEAVAQAINDDGVVVGSLGPIYEGLPVRWSSITAQPEKLPVPRGTESGAAIDIDEDGTILGTVSPKGKEGSGYLWLPDGTHRAMPLPKIDGKKATMFWPASIRNGWVVGRSVVDTEQERRFEFFRFRIATGRYERLPDDSGMPDRVAANGWIIGTARRPVITSDGNVTTELPGYRKAKGRQDYLISSFSDDGRTAAGYSSGEGVSNHPLLWECR